MEIQFAEKDMSVVLEKIRSALGGRELSKLVSFDLSGSDLVVTISKLGTSTLQFACKQNDKGSHLTLAKEKIAFAHRPLKDEVTSKIVKVIESAGGKVS